MRLKLVATSIVVETERGRFDTRIDFSDGLNVISAGNNRGKTTALMSVLYGLGLEEMIGPGAVIPLKPAAYELIADDDGVELPVLSSYVMLEIENQENRKLTVQRWLKHDQFSRDLVRTWAAGKLTNPDDHTPAEDRFTRIRGSASHEAGWHTQLARFIGWQLPEVATYAGTTNPLYMQVFFPLLFVEQTRGWSSILGAIPRHLRIRDPGRRAVEFLLDLDANERARTRELLRARETEISAEWRAATSALFARLASLGGRIEGIASSPTVEWPPAAPPMLQVMLNDSFVPFAEAVRGIRNELAVLSEDVLTAGEIVDESVSELKGAEERVARISAVLIQARGEIRAQESDLDALQARLSALDADRERYVDALKLRELGSLQPLAEEQTRCPTCDQSLPHTLQGVETDTPILTLEANLEFIEQERTTVRAMQNDARQVLNATQQRASALQRGLMDARRDVRSLKSALTQREEAPSEAVIARRVRLRDRLEDLVAFEEYYGEMEDNLAALAEDLRLVRGQLAALGRSEQSERDEEKLRHLATSLREQLDDYMFGSFMGVEVDMDSYLPEREGVDLNRGSSASDTIRLIWAYTIGLLEVARLGDSNHPGLLVMDEPGQHEIELGSLRALFRRLSLAPQFQQQVVIATSVPVSEIGALQEELGFRLHRFENRLLSRA